MKGQRLSRKELEHIAWLAHIQLSESERKLFTQQFNEILDYFRKIDNADTETVQPAYHVLDIKDVYREDDVTHSLSSSEALANAPKKEKRFLKAPRII